MMRSQRLERFLAKHSILDRSVLYRHSDRTVQRHLQDPSFPLLVSFPRTGSHQLRLLMELYFETPSLPRIFHFKKSDRFTCCHVHDLMPPDRPAGLERKRVIYLYRDPVPTVHSILRYYEEDPSDLTRVDHWSTVYRDHLRKWLLNESFTEEKLCILYESLQNDPWAPFQRLCDFFGARKEEDRLKALFHKITHEQVSKRTNDTPAIVGDRKERYEERERFRKEAGDTIRKRVFGDVPDLRPFFPEGSTGS